MVSCSVCFQPKLQWLSEDKHLELHQEGFLVLQRHDHSFFPVKLTLHERKALLGLLFRELILTHISHIDIYTHSV